MSDINFVNLHSHSTYSTFDALGWPNEYIDSAIDNGMDSIALTDHGSISGLPYQVFHTKKLKSEGKTIAAYGAPAKGNTLLNFFSIGTETLDFVVDDSKFKQGLYTPGTHLKVCSPHIISKKKPDYLLMLCWNIADEIIKKG